jgi:hypothetical protein
LQSYGSATKGCDVNGRYSVGCLTTADRKLAQAYRQYGAGIERIPFPADASAQARELVTASSSAEQGLATMAASTTLSQWYHYALGLNALLNKAESSYTSLVHALGG